MGVSTIIYSQNLQGFPDFPTTNQTVFGAGSGQTFTIPAGVNWIGVKIWGAGGGGYTGRTGSSGSYAEAILQVFPGEQLTLAVGTGGGRGGLRNGGSGGSPGGAAGGTDINVSGVTGGAGGGGYSAIFINQNRPLVMAGGGGGAANLDFIPENPLSWRYTNDYNGAIGASGTAPSGCGGGGGGGFRGGEGGGFGGARQSLSNRGTSGMTCYVSRDYYLDNGLPRKIRLIYTQSSNMLTRVGYQGYGNGGESNSAGSNGRIEITY